MIWIICVSTATVLSALTRSDNRYAITDAPRRNAAKGGRAGGGSGEGEEQHDGNKSPRD